MKFPSFPIVGAVLLIVLFSSVITLGFDYSYAAEKMITANSVGFEKTTIIEFENTGTTDVETFRLWLGSDITFKSFKTEKGWTGTKSPQGVLIFTTTEPIKPGETVKFGVKTDKEKPGINWKALDNKDEQLETGKTLVSDITSNIIEDKSSETSQKETNTSTTGILSDSSFRLIPEKPKVGSTVRVTGDSFGANQELELYMDNKKLETFQTDNNGFFIITSKIPKDEQADRVDFVVKDNAGNEKKFSLRLDEAPESERTDEVVPLSIENLPSVTHRGDVILIKGTGNPGGTVTAKITKPDGEIMTSKSTEIGLDGKWSYETLIPIDAQLGKYSATISDGKSNELRTWTVESGQKILITPSKLKYEPGETLQFNGTAIPDESIEVSIENPQGSEVFSDIIQVDSSGFVEFDFDTTLSDLQGTYVLFASQEEFTDIVMVGLGELPEAQLVLKTDKINYKAGDIAYLQIDGPPSSTVSLLIIDPSDKTKNSTSIILGPDGKKSYELDLQGFKSGVYTAVVKRANAVTEEKFGVGLQTGSGEISIQTTKTEYTRGDSILVLGDTGANIILTMSLFDEEGNEIKTKQSITNKEGKISFDSFRIPSDADSGMWSIRAESGSNYAVTEFDVVLGSSEGMEVIVLGVEHEPSLGDDIVRFRILGATHSLDIEIFSASGELVGSTSPPGKSDDYTTLWQIPDIEPGTYTIVASDGIHSANATFTYEG